MNQTFCDNYGHAGEKVIEFIMEHKDDWPLWKDAHQEFKKYYSARAGQNEVANRMSEYFATLATVIPIVHAALPKLRRDKKISEIIDHLWDCSISGADEADRAKVALEKTYGWATSNSTKFYGRNQSSSGGNEYEPSGGWAGAWKENDWKYIAFQPSKLEEILKGFEVEAILKTWKDRDWLLTDGKGRKKNTRINKIQTKCYCIKRSVLDETLDIDTEESDDED